MLPERSSIEHIDFSVVRRGYDPAEVRQRLGEIADAVEALKAAERSRQPSNMAAEQVRQIADVAAEQLREVLEAAEQSAADMRRRAEAEAGRIIEEARQRAEESDDWAQLQAVGIRRAIAAAGGLADRMGAGASSLTADLEAITWILDTRPPRPALNAPPPASHEPQTPLAITAGRGGAAANASDRSAGAEPASGAIEGPAQGAEPASGAIEEPAEPAQAASGEPQRPPSAASADEQEGPAAGDQSPPDASLHHWWWKMRTAAFEMAVAGADRSEVADHLYTTFKLGDGDVAVVDSIIAEAFQNVANLPSDDRPGGLRRLLGG